MERTGDRKPQDEVNRKHDTPFWSKTLDNEYSVAPALLSTDHAYHNNNNNNNNHIQRRYLRFFTISSQRRELSPIHTLKAPGCNRVEIMCNTLSTYHVQVSGYVPLGTKGQLSY